MKDSNNNNGWHWGSAAHEIDDLKPDNVADGTMVQDEEEETIERLKMELKSLDDSHHREYYLEGATKSNEPDTLVVPGILMYDKDKMIKPKEERVDHPDYYNLSDGPSIIINGVKHLIECIDVIRNMPTWKGNVFKYLWRCGVKKELGMSQKQKELEDMKKARWYLDDKIKEMEFELGTESDNK